MAPQQSRMKHIELLCVIVMKSMVWQKNIVQKHIDGLEDAIV